jgi:endonuclease-3
VARDSGRTIVRWAVDALRRSYGAPARPVSRDPFHLVLHEQVAYLVDDARRLAAFRRLEAEVGLSPPAIVAASPATLRAITRSGGAIGADLRARRLVQSARLALERWGGSLRPILRLPYPRARRELARFAMVGPPGADRILLLSGACPVLPLDSNGLRVLVRLGLGREGRDYAATYARVQAAAAAELPKTPTVLRAAYALLRRHGQEVCRRTAPRCATCVLLARCPHGRAALRRAG